MKKYRLYLKLLYRYYREKKSIIKTIFFAIKALFKFDAPNYSKFRGDSINKLLEKVIIDIDEEGFIHFIDIYKTLYKEKRVIDNITIDYEFILDNSLNDIKNIVNKMNNSETKKEFLITINAIDKFIDRIYKTKESKYTKYILNFKNKKTESFEEALQRILFYNQLLWQTNHNLNGLGRLDLILDKYYKHDIKNNLITKEEAEKLIEDFCNKLNKYYWFKSNGLVGDTGQIIILGGLNQNKEYFSNDLTRMFIKVIKKLNRPDPKTLLRVSKSMPDDLLELSLESIKTGIGNPLLSNDDVIIPLLIKFGYEKEDAFNYATSACWEPYIVSKSFDQNNIDTLVFVKPLLSLLNNEDLYKYKTYKSLYNEYKEYLKKYIDSFIDDINKIEFDYDPIISIVSQECLKNEKDIAIGGMLYNNYGITTVSLSNTVNSLLNIKKYCYDDKIITLNEFNMKRKNNFIDSKDLLKEMKNSQKRYGVDDDEIIETVNDITNYVSKILTSKKTRNGGKFKFGLSSPAYKSMCNVEATFDGRKNNDPFNVHISNDNLANAYTEIINFAANLDYSVNRFNGNVIDLVINPSILENNEEKFISLLKTGIDIGIFQIQMNVISSEILIEAKNNPNSYPNLIVRVWGFSAYYKDLPDSYKNILIERALINEGKNN